MRRVLVTRPLHDAQPWIQALRSHGLDAQALPLLAIGPCSAPAGRQALAAARAAALRPGHYRAVMFVSGNAVSHFFQQDCAATLAGPTLLAPQTRAWTPGPGTARALLQLGLEARRIDGPPADAAQFESETLWQQVSGQVRAGDRVLIVRGASPAAAPAAAASAAAGSPAAGSPAAAPAPASRTAGAGRDWLAARLREAGAQVELLAVYERQLPRWSPDQRAMARSAGADGSIWLFSSSEAVANLQQLLPDQDWHSGRALATHERIAGKARAAGFGLVLQSRPALEDVVASIESLHELRCPPRHP